MTTLFNISRSNRFALSIVLLVIALISCKKETNLPFNQNSDENLLTLAKKQFNTEMSAASNSLAKSIKLTPIWENAITSEAGDIRVPIIFSLKSKNSPGITDDLFELSIKKVKENAQLSLIHFIKVGNVYHSEVLKLNGDRTNPLIFQRRIILDGETRSSSRAKGFVMEGTGDTGDNLTEYFSTLYGKSVILVAVQHCPEGLRFNPSPCQCDFPENIDNDAPFDDSFLLIVFEDGEAIARVNNFLNTVIITPSPDPNFPSEPNWPPPSGGGGGSGGTGGGGGGGDNSGDDGGYTSTSPVINNFILNPTSQANYPKFTALLKDLKNIVKNDAAILDALKKWSGFSESQILEKVEFGKGPEIIVKDLNDRYGYFNASENPNVINVDASWVRGLESANLLSTRQATAFLLGVTVLHEFVHQAREANGLNTSTYEYGIGFENSAFGIVIEKNNASKYSYRFYKK